MTFFQLKVLDRHKAAPIYEDSAVASGWLGVASEHKKTTTGVYFSKGFQKGGKGL